MIQLLGSTGVSVIIAIYLVHWITTKLDQKLNDLIHRIDEMNRIQREFYEKLINVFERKIN